MKKIFISILILFSVKAASQSFTTPPTPQAFIIFNTINEMTAYTGTYYLAYVKDTVRGGFFTGIINAAYTVDNAIIFQGMGRQWLRQVTQAGGIKISWWVQADSTVDCARKINAAELYAFHWNNNDKIDSPNTSSSRRTTAYSTRPHVIFDSKLYGIDTSVILLASVINDFNGCGLKDISTNGVLFMVRNVNSGNESIEIPPTSPYYRYSGGYTAAQRNQIISNLILDGNYKAKNGLMIETSSFSKLENLYVANVKGSSWVRGALTITQNKTVSFDSTIDPDDDGNLYDRWVLINDISPIYRGGTFAIYRPSEGRYLRGIYQMYRTSVSDTLWSQADFQESMLIGDQIVSVPTGYIQNTNEFITNNVTVVQCGLGVMVGRNRAGSVYDDNTFYTLHLTDNNWGIAFNRASRSTVYHSTLQRSNFGNIEILQGQSIDIHDAYIEITGRRGQGAGHADSLLYNENYSSTYIDCDACTVGTLGPFHPLSSADSDGVHNFLRYYEVMGDDNTININCTNINFKGFVSSHNDSALIRMRQKRGFGSPINVNISGTFTFNKLNSMASAVVDSNYQTYLNSAISGGSEKLNTYALGQKVYSGHFNYSPQSAINFYTTANAQSLPSLIMDSSGIRMGSGSFATAYVAKTGTYTATSSDHTIDCTANTFTVTLPTAASIAGREYVITNSGAGTITIAATSATFTNVATTPTTLTLAGLGFYTVQSTGSGWIVIAH